MRTLGTTTVLALSLLALTLGVRAATQEEAAPVLEEARTVDGLIDALYGAVSFGPGGEPDWDLLRDLMLEEAILVQPVRGKEGMHALSVEGFLDVFRKDLAETPVARMGFHETPAHRQTATFGDLGHAFVVFEMRWKPEDEKMLGRGLDSIELVRRGGRWWVASITTEHERPNRPMPERFLTSEKD